VQNSYSLLDRAAERELFPLCAATGVGFMAFSPLAGGWLTGKYGRGKPYPEGSRMTLRPEPYHAFEREAVYGALDGLARDAAERGVTMSALALGWVLHQPGVDSAVIGPRRPEHIDAAVAALDVRLQDRGRALGLRFDQPAGGNSA
jgi:aryl-alcohol dehydrogenase-like predicted oxidoreductase